MTPNELLGWLASGLVFGAFCSRRMVPLRVLAIGSNLAFIGYGVGAHIWPVVVLHIAMLPVNIIRVRQSVSIASRAAFNRHSGVADATAWPMRPVPISALPGSAAARCPDHSSS